ncbi:MAG: NAD(P)-dependent oxidoreductase [Chloroflexi bacterium]|nr:NAD(P)-dependent oxidoreductase [Chloroflexota bacterium]
MSIMVVGGTGFIGKAIVRALAGRGERVVSFGRTVRQSDQAGLGAVSAFQGDLARLEDLSRAIRKQGVERIIAVAGVITGTEERIVDIVRTNALGYANVFEAARLAGISRVVYTSALSVYGLQHVYGERPITEEDPPRPLYLRGIIATLNEAVARRYADEHGLSVVGLRPTVLYGPGQRQHGRRPAWWSARVELVANPALGRPAIVDYPAQQRACLVYVDDVAEMFVRLCKAPEVKHDVYNTGGHTATFGELAEVVRQVIPGAEITFHESDEIEKRTRALQYVYMMDCDRFRREFGFEHRSLRDGVLAFANAVRADSGLPPLAE